MKTCFPPLEIFCAILCAAASGQSELPSLYPVTGGQESLPLRVMSTTVPVASRLSFSRQASTVTPCSSGGTAGNFTIVLNCDGNDNDGSSAYEDVPDTDLAVSEQYVMQTVDNVFTIYNKLSVIIASS